MRSCVGSFLEEYRKRFAALNVAVDSLVLFGSQAKGTATLSSDIDIAVVMNHPLSHFERGKILSLAEEIDPRFETNLFFTTQTAVSNGEGIFNTNKYIREEGVLLWQP